MRRRFEASLNTCGFITYTCNDGLEALNWLQTNPTPDLMITDVEMPNMDGLEFLEKLMRLHPLPVIMISSHTLEGSAATLRALELGAVDFIAKPKSYFQ